MKYILLLLTILPIQSIACSAFFSDGEIKYFAKNFDWSSGQGYIIKNKIGEQKFAYGLRGANQAHWTSRYGSITFNQIGKEFPYGGMNDQGLVVEQLWMSESFYQDNQNQTISELEWIQYQLDNYATVDEILQQINALTIKPIATVHFFIADRNGHSAVIDFVEGKTVISKKQGKHQVITNETLLRSETYFELNKTSINKASRTHFDRYCQIKNSLSAIAIEKPDQAFELLANSSENKPNYKTYWTIVYDLSNLHVYFKSFDNKTVKQFSLQDINFQQSSATEASLINQDQFKLQTYTLEMNTAIFQAATKMMSIRIDQEMGALHQMNPNVNRIDKIYQENHIDLIIHFQSKSSSGNIYFVFLSSEENFKKRVGAKTGILAVNKQNNRRAIYGLSKGEYAIACYQDTNLDGKLDTKFFGIPKNYGFSRNNRGIFGMPPNYEAAKMEFKNDTELTIKIK